LPQKKRVPYDLETFKLRGKKRGGGVFGNLYIEKKKLS